MSTEGWVSSGINFSHSVDPLITLVHVIHHVHFDVCFISKIYCIVVKDHEEDRQTDIESTNALVCRMQHSGGYGEG